ncbi:hypothetical protein KEB97_004303 [Salmonella enterica]|nr:hypothetical protein [Salmonella enterica]
MMNIVEKETPPQTTEDAVVADEYILNARMEDSLVMLTKQLACQLAKAEPDSKWPADAMDYLTSRELVGAADWTVLLDNSPLPFRLQTAILELISTYFEAFITDDDLVALQRFAECCDAPESGGHDLDKEQVHRLVKIGLLHCVKVNYHEITHFGSFILSVLTDELSGSNT